MTDDVDKDGLPRLPALTRPAVAESLPGLARVAGSAALHTASWGMRTTTRNWLRVGKAVTSRDEAASLIRDVGSYVGALGEVAKQVSGGVPVATALMRAGETLGGSGSNGYGGPGERPVSIAPPVVDGQVTSSRTQTLRERGNDLLEKSRDVWSQDDRHPAFDRILDELAPDEARILVLLHRAGPQPSVDVRTSGLSPRPVAQALTMIPARAGLRHLDRMAPYLNNLERLGLVEDSREALPDHGRYQVLEAQPDVLAAMASVRLAKVVRRSIRLTPFGADFVAAALVDPDELPLP